MIPCTEFILAYSELFKFLHERHGRGAVVRFWEELSDEYLKNLRDLARTRGLQGLRIYWTHTLEEEGAEYDMYMTPDTFTIEMHRCPSVAKLRRARHITPYRHYCDHCDVLYARVINDYGMCYRLEKIDEREGVCRLTVVKKPGAGKKGEATARTSKRRRGDAPAGGAVRKRSAR